MLIFLGHANRTMSTLLDYLIPKAPERISQESIEAFRKDMGNVVDTHENRMKVDPFIRNSDRQVRNRNRQWFKKYGHLFIRRWAVVFFIFMITIHLGREHWWIQLPAGIMIAISLLALSLLFSIKKLIERVDKDGEDFDQWD